MTEMLIWKQLRTSVGMVISKTYPFPNSFHENVIFGQRIHGNNKKSELDVIVEASLKSVALWDEVKDSIE